MESPDIRYVSSGDGTRIAVTHAGHGPGAVISTLHAGDRIDAPGPGSRHWLQLLAPHRRTARFDVRGCGLSDRSPIALGTGQCVDDLAAAVASLSSPEPVVLVGLSHGACVAVDFAVARPDRVSRLVLYGGLARGRLRRQPSPAQAEETRTITEAMRVAFSDDLAYTPGFRQALLAQFFPEASASQQRELERDIFWRMDGDTAAAYSELGYRFDLREIAPRVKCPTLVLHARGDQVVPFEEGRLLASLIPGAQFVPLDARNHMPLDGDAVWPQVASELRRFLGLGPHADPAAGDANVPTPRQVQVLGLVSRGHTDKEVARMLGLSPRTVEMHVAHAMQILNCRTRSEAVQVALRQRLLE